MASGVKSFIQRREVSDSEGEKKKKSTEIIWEPYARMHYQE